MVELIRYFNKHPIHRQVRLRYPVTQAVISNLQDNDLMGTCQAEASIRDSQYVSNIQVKAKYQYKAKRADELTFPKHAIIQNVNKAEEHWWKGDYGGQRQFWFPAIYVDEMGSELLEDKNEHQVLGSLQKGSIDISRARIELKSVKEPNYQNVQFLLRLIIDMPPQIMELGCKKEDEANEWIEEMRKLETCSDRGEPKGPSDHKRSQRVAKAISDLVVYFSTTPFKPHIHLEGGAMHNEISSMSETKIAEHFKRPRDLLKFHQLSFSRVYPKGARLDSSNYSPCPMWNHGCQIVSLNYQTGGNLSF